MRDKSKENQENSAQSYDDEQVAIGGHVPVASGDGADSGAEDDLDAELTSVAADEDSDDAEYSKHHNEMEGEDEVDSGAEDEHGATY